MERVFRLRVLGAVEPLAWRRLFVSYEQLVPAPSSASLPLLAYEVPELCEPDTVEGAYAPAGGGPAHPPRLGRDHTCGGSYQPRLTIGCLVYVREFEFFEDEGMVCAFPFGIAGGTEGYDLKDAAMMASDWLRI